jgi:ferritin-like metal-binding protein YciE
MERDVQSILHSYIRDAHAREENVLRMLDSMISTTEDPQILQGLNEHRTETERHETVLRERLEALGVDVTAVKDVPAIFGALVKGIGTPYGATRRARMLATGT